MAGRQNQHVNNFCSVLFSTPSGYCKMFCCASLRNTYSQRRALIKNLSLGVGAAVEGRHIHGKAEILYCSAHYVTCCQNPLRAEKRQEALHAHPSNSPNRHILCIAAGASIEEWPAHLAI